MRAIYTSIKTPATKCLENELAKAGNQYYNTTPGVGLQEVRNDTNDMRLRVRGEEETEYLNGEGVRESSRF